MAFVPCTRCRCHVRVHEPACPFCGASLDALPNPKGPPRLSRAARLVLKVLLGAGLPPAVACAASPKPAPAPVPAASSIASSASASTSTSAAPSASASDSTGAPRLVAIYGATTVEILVVVPFALGSAELAKSSDDLLREIVTVLNANPKFYLLVEGHVETVEGFSAASRVELGKKRAEAVRARLVALGAAADHLRTTSVGDTQPVTSGATAAERAKNRAVRFRVVNEDGSPASL